MTAIKVGSGCGPDSGESGHSTHLSFVGFCVLFSVVDLLLHI